MSYVINPSTGRPIRVGSTVHRKLCLQGVISDEEQSQAFAGKRVYKLKPEDNIQEKIDEHEETETEQTVKGRGVHKGHLVKRNKVVSEQAVAKATTSILKKKNKDHVLTDLEKRIAKHLGLNSDGEGVMSSDSDSEN